MELLFCIFGSCVKDHLFLELTPSSPLPVPVLLNPSLLSPLLRFIRSFCCCIGEQKSSSNKLSKLMALQPPPSSSQRAPLLSASTCLFYPSYPQLRLQEEKIHKTNVHWLAFEDSTFLKPVTVIKLNYFSSFLFWPLNFYFQLLSSVLVSTIFSFRVW